MKFWIDQESLNEGDWWDKLNEALDTCRRMVLCVSPDALDPASLKVEYRYFFTSRKDLHPVILRQPPKLPPELQVIQYKHYHELAELIQVLKVNS